MDKTSWNQIRMLHVSRHTSNKSAYEKIPNAKNLKIIWKIQQISTRSNRWVTCLRTHLPQTVASFLQKVSVETWTKDADLSQIM